MKIFLKWTEIIYRMTMGTILLVMTFILFCLLCGMCLKKDQEAEHYKKLWQMQTQRYDFCLSYFNEDKAQEITNKSLRNLKEEQKHETD